jgi:hypothetical protein
MLAMKTYFAFPGIAARSWRRREGRSLSRTPRALLAITLAASLYTDTANALILAAFFRWFGV